MIDQSHAEPALGAVPQYDSALQSSHPEIAPYGRRESAVSDRITGLRICGFCSIASWLCTDSALLARVGQELLKSACNWSSDQVTFPVTRLYARNPSFVLGGSHPECLNHQRLAARETRHEAIPNSCHSLLHCAAFQSHFITEARSLALTF